MSPKRLATYVWEFLSVSALSLVLGIGIGFFQGDLSTGSELGEIRMVLPNEGAMTGMIFSLPIGWIVYYLMLHRNLSFRALRNAIGTIVLISVAMGLAVGHFTKGEAAFASSLFMIVIVFLVFGVIVLRTEGRGSA
jgi:hypothetical protein